MSTVRIPVLTYHAIEAAATPIAVSPDRFAATMRAMRAAGWRTAGDSEVLNGLAGGRWPERTFVLHFDDGFASVATHAAPVLAECGFTATIFVVADWVGRDNGWPSQPAGVPRWPLLDWDALRALRDAGHRFGAHTASHPHLPALSSAEQAIELDRCAARIQQEIGVGPGAFAYPYGDADRASRAAVSTRYQLAYGTTLDFVVPSSDRWELPRIDAWYLAPQRAARLDDAAVSRWLAGRRVLRRLRRAVTRLG